MVDVLVGFDAANAIQAASADHQMLHLAKGDEGFGVIEVDAVQLQRCHGCEPGGDVAGFPGVNRGELQQAEGSFRGP